MRIQCYSTMKISAITSLSSCLFLCHVIYFNVGEVLKSSLRHEMICSELCCVYCAIKCFSVSKHPLECSNVFVLSTLFASLAQVLVIKFHFFFSSWHWFSLHSASLVGKSKHHQQLLINSSRSLLFFHLKSKLYIFILLFLLSAVGNNQRLFFFRFFWRY